MTNYGITNSRLGGNSGILQTITATNNSSYDRQANEKVWIVDNNGSYEIVDYKSTALTAYSGVCVSSIAIGQSGDVYCTVGGNVVNHEVSDYYIDSLSHATVDDSAKLMYVGLSQDNSYIESLNNVYDSSLGSPIGNKLKTRVKFLLASGSGTVTLPSLELGRTTKVDDLGNYNPTDSMSNKTFSLGTDSNGFLSATYYDGNTSGSSMVLNTLFLQSDTWYNIEMVESTNQSTGCYLKVTDDLGNTYQVTGSATPYTSSNNLRVRRVYLGNNLANVQIPVSAVFDLSATEFYMQTSSSGYPFVKTWTPYKDVID